MISNKQYKEDLVMLLSIVNILIYHPEEIARAKAKSEYLMKKLEAIPDEDEHPLKEYWKDKPSPITHPADPSQD